MPNKTGGDIKSANVVAANRGKANLDMNLLVLGAHRILGELGTGALDMAQTRRCNRALRANQGVRLKAERRIRLLSFFGEEEGMLGSKAYRTQHRMEMDKGNRGVILDEGKGAPWKDSLLGGPRRCGSSRMKKMAAPLRTVEGEMAGTTDAFGETD